MVSIQIVLEGQRLWVSERSGKKDARVRISSGLSSVGSSPPPLTLATHTVFRYSRVPYPRPYIPQMSKRRLSVSQDSNDRPAKRAETESARGSLVPSASLPYPPLHSSTSIQPVPFQQPTGLLTFSYTPQRVLEFTNSALRYYIDPPPGADLRYGYERWIKRPEEKSRLDGLLRAIERLIEKADASMGFGSGQKWLHDIAVVTWRGVMTK